MARIAFILLCHKGVDAIIAQAKGLVAGGAYVAIHFDASASADDFDRIKQAFQDCPDVTLAARRVRCGWGEWSLVQASLNAAKAALEAFPEATHLYMLSGDCGAIKSASYANKLLSPGDRDFIESYDFFASDWIRTGLRGERLIYRHVFNERNRKGLFYASMNLQKRLGFERKPPADLQIMVGSQWWCLRRRTVEAILAFLDERPDVIRFFRYTWIPDETFFQTLVRHLVPSVEIENRSLTFKLFSDYGMPVTFYNDHYDLLLTQDYLFARKISPEATNLKANLHALWDSDREDFAISGDGERLHGFLTGRGRVGRRFAQRFWEREASIGRDRQLILIISKKWHVGKRLLAAVEAETGVPGVEYLFDEETCPLPDLGGLERNLEKRNRHRRALLRMLFEYHNTNRLVICVDPGNLDLLNDLTSDRAETHLLELHCAIDDAYLTGHAERVGLANGDTPPEIIDRLLPTLRHEFSFESERIREAQFANHHRIAESDLPDVQARALADIFGIDADQALRITQTPHLFDD